MPTLEVSTSSPPWAILAYHRLALPILNNPGPPTNTAAVYCGQGWRKCVFFLRKKTGEQYINAQASKFILKKSVHTKIDISKKVKSDSILFQKGNPFSSTFSFFNFDYLCHTAVIYYRISV